MRTKRLVFRHAACDQIQANQVDEWELRLIQTQIVCQTTYLIIDNCTEVKFVGQAVKGTEATVVAPLGFLTQTINEHCLCVVLVISLPLMQMCGPVLSYAIAEVENTLVNVFLFQLH